MRLSSAPPSGRPPAAPAPGPRAELPPPREPAEPRSTSELVAADGRPGDAAGAAAGPPDRRAPGPLAAAGGAAGPDPADVLLGVLSLAVALARSTVARAVQVPRAVVDRLPVPAGVRRRVLDALERAEALGRAERSSILDRLGALTDVVVPWAAPVVLSRLDVVALVREFVDVDRIAAQLDVDAVVARVDIDAVLAGLDLNAIAARLDLDELVAHVDVARILDRVDLDAIVERVDLDRIIDRVDIDRVLDRVDLDAVVERVDVDKIAARLDLDPVIARADILGLARYVVEGIDLAALIRSSTGTVGAEVVRGVRASSADADQAVERIVDRLLLRRRPRRTGDPPGGGDGRPDEEART
jgi:hypothetical protein